MKKQTAVEWLLEQLDPLVANNYLDESIISIAKEMEKEQIIAARNDCFVWPEYDSEEYYDMTYGKEETK